MRVESLSARASSFNTQEGAKQKSDRDGSDEGQEHRASTSELIACHQGNNCTAINISSLGGSREEGYENACLYCHVGNDRIPSISH